MEDKDYLCFKCRKFQRYYTRGRTEFKPTKMGWCSHKRGEIKGTDGCEAFVYKKKQNHLNYDVKYRLNTLFTEITVIRNILEEEHREIEEGKKV